MNIPLKVHQMEILSRFQYYGATSCGSLCMNHMLFLLIKDSDSKVEGESALHIASYTGSASAVKVLVELGADPNSLNEV